MASKQSEEVDEPTGVVEERVVGQFPLRNLAGLLADLLFELLGVVEGQVEELADQEQVEELLLDFGVHDDFVGHVGDQGG